MAIDVRASVTCSLGTLISASISDDYIQGSGLIKCKGSCEISGVISPPIGSEVTFGYVKGGVSRQVPRKLRVLSSFADPFRRITKVELGCKLTYLQDLKEPVDWKAADDPANAAIPQAEADVIVVPIQAASVMAECLSKLGLTASSNPLTNNFSVANFEFSAGYVQVLSDLLVSECYCGYLDESEVLQVLPLTEGGGTGPVITSSQIIDLGPIGVGQLPGEAVTVSYSNLQLRNSGQTAQEYDPQATNQTIVSGYGAQWVTSSTSSRSQVAVPYTNPQGVSTYETYNTSQTIQENSFYISIGDRNVISRRLTTETTSAVSVLGAFFAERLAVGLPAFNYDVNATTNEVFEYDSSGNLLRSTLIRKGAIEHGIGSLGVRFAFSATDYLTLPSISSFPLEKVITTYVQNGAFRKVITERYGPWCQTVQGQQAIAAGAADFTTSTEVAAFVNSGVLQGEYLLDVSYRTEEATSGDNAPSGAQMILGDYAKDPAQAANSFRTQNQQQLELALGSATAQRRIELSMPYAPDDVFVKLTTSYATANPVSYGGYGAALAATNYGNAANTYSYYAITSDAAAKANRYGRVQNKLLMGNRNGMNLQLAPESLPSAPFAPFIVQANGLSALYRTNGTSWTMDANGIVVSTDALFWGAVGGTGTSFWFPVAPGITSLPTTPPVVDGEMTVTSVVPEWNETVVADATVRATLGVQSLAYALELLSEAQPIGVTTGLAVTSFRSIGPAAIAFELGAPAPAVSAGASVQVPATAAALEAVVPKVSIGALIGVPVVDLSLQAPVPEQAGPDALKVLATTAEIGLAVLAPSISTGAQVAVPAASITASATAPDVLISDYFVSLSSQVYGWDREFQVDWWGD